MRRMLLLVDPQIDFITGSLKVPGAKEAMAGLSAFLVNNDKRYSDIIITLDFHPWNHCSFQSSGGMWPKHCLAGSAGAAIWPVLNNALACSSARIHTELKGCAPDREEYSIFRNMEARKRLTGLFENTDEIELCGIAGDVCVLDTLKDGIKLINRKFKLLKEFSPSIDGGRKLDNFARYI